MKKLTAITVFCAAVLACLALFTPQPAPVSSQEVQSGWLGSSLIHQIQSESSTLAPRSPIGAYCADYTFILKKNPSNQINYDSINSPCAVYTSFGVASGNYLHEHDEKYAGLVPPRASSYHWLPNSDSLIEIRNSRLEKHFRVYRGFITKSQPKNVNWVFNTHKLTADYILAKNWAGQPVNVDASPLYASTNNQWTLAYSPNRGSVRISMDTGESLIFGQGAKPSAFAVSDDGRYAAVYYMQSRNTILYDLDTCVVVSPGAKNPLDCQSRDLTGYINDNFGPINKVERFKFFGSNHLEPVLNQTVGGQTQYTTLQITPSGQFLEQNRSYIAMGDSFASGEGDMDDAWYEVGTDEPENKCHLSRRSYPYLINESLQLDEFHSVACSGAVINDVLTAPQNEQSPTTSTLGDWLPGDQVQVDYLDDTLTRAVSISIGGNDVGFAEKLKECVISLGTCSYAQTPTARAKTAMEIASVFDDLVNTYKQLTAKTNGKTKIYTIAYPRFVSVAGDECAQNVHLNREERIFIAKATRYMNQVVEAASQKAGVYFLDIEGSLAGFNLCSGAESKDIAFNGITFGNDNKVLPAWLFAPADELIKLGNESYHPNQNGHRLMAQNILELAGNDLLNFTYCSSGLTQAVCPVDVAVPAPEDYWGSAAAVFVDNINDSNFIPVETVPQRKQLLVGSPVIKEIITLKAGNLKPSSEVVVEVHSEPVELGTYITNDQGVLELSVPISSQIEPGFHNLRLFGLETTGEPIEYYQQILVLGEEGDLDNDGIEDSADPCGFVPASGIDQDKDGVDDACDGVILGLAVADEPAGTQSSQNNEEADGTDSGEPLDTESAQEERVVVVSNNSSGDREVLVGTSNNSVFAQTSGSTNDTANDKANFNLLPFWILGLGLGFVVLSFIIKHYSTSS